MVLAPAPAPVVRFDLDGSTLEGLWRSESNAPSPTRLRRVGDALTADAALRRVRQGEFLLYDGDFRNARQLLSAMERRLARSLELRRGPGPKTALEVFRAERNARLQEHATLSRLVVLLDPRYRLALQRAPLVAAACAQAWGRVEVPTVVSLKTLVGVLGAAEWYRRGLEVPGLTGRLHPHYGVFSPTRREYVELLSRAPAPEGKRLFDVGTGTGVLSFVLLQRGAASSVATDLDARAVACATENAQRLGLTPRFEAQHRSLFPDGLADLVVCNPPWIPEAPKNRLDRAVFDPEGAVLDAFLAGLAGHLSPRGEGWLLLSNLAELLGLRSATFLEQRLAEAGLTVKWRHSTAPAHPRAQDRDDPLHAARSTEIVTLYGLVPPPGPLGAR